MTYCAVRLSVQRGFDVFSAMDVMDNKAFLEPLKFRMGEVHKQYYLYNWRCPEISSDKVIKHSVIV